MKKLSYFWATMLTNITGTVLLTQGIVVLTGLITYEAPYENMLWYCLAAFLLSWVYAVIIMSINAYRIGRIGRG